MHVRLYIDYSVQFRKDKYEPDVLEFWIDVRCTGELRKTYSEICIRRFEVADSGHAMPAPMKIGSTPMPAMPDQDEVDYVDDDDGEGSAETPKRKKAKKNAATEEETPPRLSKKGAQKKAQEEELAEDISCNVSICLFNSNRCDHHPHFHAGHYQCPHDAEANSKGAEQGLGCRGKNSGEDP